jgi:uncharacterized membrane protein YeaQ/YmgE (transglycosylase-associated protein family)
MLVKGDEGYGVIGTIIAGILGAMLGGFLVGIVTGENYMDEFTIGSIIAAVVGAVIVVLAWRALSASAFLGIRRTTANSTHNGATECAPRTPRLA